MSTKEMRTETDESPALEDDRADDLLDTIRENRGKCLKLARSDEETTTAFAQFAPGGPHERYYWFEFGEDDFGHSVQQDRHVPRAALGERIAEWETAEVYPSLAFADAIVSTAPESWWFWAEDIDGLESQLKDHYHSGVHVASTAAHTGGFAVANLFPTAKAASDDRGDNSNTAQARSVLETCVFYETELHEGHGYYAVELPRPDVLRKAFRDSRPVIERRTACESCAVRLDESRHFCDWCGTSQVEYEQPLPSRAKRAIRTLPERVVQGGRSLVGQSVVGFEEAQWRASVRLRRLSRQVQARLDSSRVPAGDGEQ